MSLSREALLKPVEVPVEKVELPELGGSVNVRGMTARGRSDFERQFSANGKTIKSRQNQIRERLVVACVVDDDGKQLLTEADVESIGRQSAKVIERIVNVAQRLCGMTNDDVEELAKNSQETPADS